MRTETCTQCGIFFHPNGRETRCRECRFPSHVPTWHDVAGFAGRYQITVNGDIRCIVRRPLLLRPTPQKSGYAVTLIDGQGQKSKHMIQRLLLMTFRPIDTPETHYAKPVNGNHLDTRLINWTWVERWYTNNVKLDAQTVTSIRDMIADTPDISYHRLASQVGISAMQIYRIARGEQWRDL